MSQSRTLVRKDNSVQNHYQPNTLKAGSHRLYAVKNIKNTVQNTFETSLKNNTLHFMHALLGIASADIHFNLVSPKVVELTIQTQDTKTLISRITSLFSQHSAIYKGYTGQYFMEVFAVGQTGEIGRIAYIEKRDVTTQLVLRLMDFDDAWHTQPLTSLRTTYYQLQTQGWNVSV